MAAMYAIYHGPEGLKAIARRVNGLAVTFGKVVEDAGLKLKVAEGNFFDTVTFKVNNAKELEEFFFTNRVNVRTLDKETVVFSFDETHTV
jgi:glycine dehydrogenase